MTNRSIDCGHYMGAAPETTYLTWDKSLLTSATEWLLADESCVLADLSGTLLLLPTQHAGRRLREALANAMAKRGGGLFPQRRGRPASGRRPCAPMTHRWGARLAFCIRRGETTSL